MNLPVICFGCSEEYESWEHFCGHVDMWHTSRGEDRSGIFCCCGKEFMPLSEKNIKKMARHLQRLDTTGWEKHKLLAKMHKALS